MQRSLSSRNFTFSTRLLTCFLVWVLEVGCKRLGEQLRHTRTPGPRLEFVLVSPFVGAACRGVASAHVSAPLVAAAPEKRANSHARDA